jgi:hypothetical protein
MAEATQQLPLQHWPAEGRRFGEIIKEFVGAEAWLLLTKATDGSQHIVHLAPGDVISYAPNDRWVEALTACRPFLTLWTSGALIAKGRRGDPLADPVEIAPPSIGWEIWVVSFTRSIIRDPAGGEIYDLRFSPRAPCAPEELAGAAVWIVPEAKRLKAADRIPEKARKTPTALAKFLSDRMHKAVETDKALQPVGWRHIKNQLVRWHLWPIESIE